MTEIEREAIEFMREHFGQQKAELYQELIERGCVSIDRKPENDHFVIRATEEGRSALKTRGQH